MFCLATQKTAYIYRILVEAPPDYSLFTWQLIHPSIPPPSHPLSPPPLPLSSWAQSWACRCEVAAEPSFVSNLNTSTGHGISVKFAQINSSSTHLHSLHIFFQSSARQTGLFPGLPISINISRYLSNIGDCTPASKVPHLCSPVLYSLIRKCNL
jgi:hypothetical protein